MSRWVSATRLLQQHTATPCSTLQHTATHCSTLQDSVTHYDTLQYTVTHCNTLQYTAIHRNTLHQVSATRLLRLNQGRYTGLQLASCLYSGTLLLLPERSYRKAQQPKFVTLSFEWHGSLVCVTWLFHMHPLAPLQRPLVFIARRNNPSSWLCHVRQVTDSCAWRDSFMTISHFDSRTNTPHTHLHGHLDTLMHKRAHTHTRGHTHTHACAYMQHTIMQVDTPTHAYACVCACVCACVYMRV